MINMWQLLDLIYLENYEPRWLLIRLKNYLLFSVITFQLYYQLRYNKRLAKYFLTFISILSVRGFRKTSILRKVIPKIIRYKKMETYLNNITPLAENNRISTVRFWRNAKILFWNFEKSYLPWTKYIYIQRLTPNGRSFVFCDILESP